MHVHVPFYLLIASHLPLFIRERIRPEISFGASELDTFKREDFRRVGESFADAGIPVTLHAPFMDLRPGAVDAKIRQVSLDRLRQVFDLAPLFRPRSIVCHPSYDSRYYVSNEREWMENSAATWMSLLPAARELNLTIALENVYEREPGILKELIEVLDSPHVRLCFDTGHFNVFARKPLEEWLDSLGTLIGQLHLHDNHRLFDEHLPVGEGLFPFLKLFSRLGELKMHPIVTVEPHSEEHLWRTLKNIERMGLLEFIQ